MPCASRSGRQHRQREVRGQGGDVVAPPGEDDAGGDPRAERGGLGAERIGLRSLADDRQPRLRHGPEDRGHRVDQVAMSLLRLEPRDHAEQRGRRRDPIFATQRARPHRPAEPRQVDPVRDDREPGAVPTLGVDLARDRLGRNDQPVHRRGERRQEPDVVVGSDARRVDGRHDHRGAGGDRRPRPDHLGAEHVRVDEVDLLAPQPGHELADGDLVIGLVEHLDRDAERAEALHGRAGRQREGADLVSRSVQAEQQSGVALLGAAVAAGREQLEDPRARMAAGPMNPPMPGVRRAGDGALVVGLLRTELGTRHS